MTVTIIRDYSQYDNAAGTVTAQTSGYVPPSWTAPALLNSWVNYGSGYNNAGYYKDRATRLVHRRGMVKSGTVGAAIFTLPAGFRPPAKMRRSCPANGHIGEMTMATDGTVALAPGSNAYMSLDGIAFRTD